MFWSWVSFGWFAWWRKWTKSERDGCSMSLLIWRYCFLLSVRRILCWTGEPGTGKKTLLENIIKSSPSYRSTSSHHHSSTTTSTTTATSSYSPFNYPSIHPPNTSQSKSNKSNGIRSGNTLNNNHHDGSSESKTSSHHSQHTHPKTIDSQQLMSDPSIPLSNLGISYEWLDINNEEGDQSSIGGGGGGGGDNIPNLGFCIPNGSGLEVRELVKNGAGVGLDILRVSCLGEIKES